jgi:hypothetical protein
VSAGNPKLREMTKILGETGIRLRGIRRIRLGRGEELSGWSGRIIHWLKSAQALEIQEVPHVLLGISGSHITELLLGELNFRALVGPQYIGRRNKRGGHI